MILEISWYTDRHTDRQTARCNQNIIAPPYQAGNNESLQFDYLPAREAEVHVEEEGGYSAGEEVTV